MKKMILLVIMSMCILTGCNSSDNNGSGSDDIIGKWQGSDIESIEFKEDGTFTMSDKGTDTKGTYKIEENQVSLSSSENGVIFNPSYYFEVENDKLLLKRTDHDFEYRFAREK